jgi:hypothetical protein
MSEVDTSIQTAPVEMSEQETDQVAGGLTFLAAGCSACRSGLDLKAMSAMQAVVQPATQLTKLGGGSLPGTELSGGGVPGVSF